MVGAVRLAEVPSEVGERVVPHRGGGRRAGDEALPTIAEIFEEG